MKTIAGTFIMAIVLMVAGAVGLSEARLMRRMAGDQQRLSTLQYDEAARGESQRSLVDRLSLPVSGIASVESQRAAEDYWRARYDALTPLANAAGGDGPGDPEVLLIAANATFRASSREAGDARAAVERLDRAMQAYAAVLRADPDNPDAAYNYEYVARMRDGLARGGRSTTPASGERTVVLSPDLPVGPTLHGRPGGPPADVPMADFKTFRPLSTDERGEQQDADRKRVPRGKG